MLGNPWCRHCRSCKRYRIVVPLPDDLLREVRERLEAIKHERERLRRERGEPVMMGSYAEDEPYLHFLHASEDAQWRIAEEDLGIDVEAYR